MSTEFVQNNIFYRIYDDMTEMVDESPTPPVDDPWWKTITGLTNWKDLLAKCQTPNPEVDDTVREMIDGIEGSEIPEPQVVKRRPRYNEFGGDEICMDRLRSGQPFWRGMTRSQSHGTQNKRIIIDVSTGANVPTGDVYWRGAAGLAVTEMLEKAGYQVEIWVVNTSRNSYTNGQANCLATMVKGANDNLDIDSISTVISGWFYRSIWFRCWERRDATPVESLGYPRTMNRKDYETLFGEEWNDDDVVYISGVFSKESATLLAKKVLGEYSGDIPSDAPKGSSETRTLVNGKPSPRKTPQPKPSPRRDTNFDRLLQRLKRM